MSGSLNEQITKTLAYAFFSSATPFRFVENAVFKECFALLRPSYKLPSRQMLSGTLLNEAYDELHTKMLRQIAAARHVACDRFMDGYQWLSGHELHCIDA